MNVERARERFEQIDFAKFLGVKVLAVEPERAVVRLPFQPENANPNGPLHGGATASLLNLAGALAVWTGVDLAVASLLRTVDFSLQYAAAAMREDVTAEAKVLRRGRDIFFLDVAAWGASQQLISKGLIIYRTPQYTESMRWHTQPPILGHPPVQVTPLFEQNHSGFTHRLQITTAYRQDGRVRLCMPCRQEYRDETGNLHEGALAALLDTAGTYAAWSLVQPQGARGSTIGMQLNYTGASAENVVADAQVQQRSEEIFFSLVQIRAVSTDQLVAMGNVSYRLLEARSGAMQIS
jgi:uncharacterized protein (TIGR00369 family)